MNEITETETIFKQSITFWFGFFCIVCIEFFLFRTYVLREVIEYYPPAADQTAYLSKVYGLYEHVLQSGFHLNLIKLAASAPSISFFFQTMLFLLIVGASRYTALLYGFFCFVLLQYVIIRTLFFLTRSYELAAIFLGFLLSVCTPFLISGGITDFRIDFTAFLLYGIFACGVIRSKIFLDRKWSIFSALLACWLALTRTITLVYIYEILFFMGIYYLWQFYQSRKKNTQQTLPNKLRLQNIGLFFIISLFVIAPFFWMVRDFIYQYYVVVHTAGDAAQARVTETVTSFYAKEARKNNLFFFDYLSCGLIV